MVFPGESFDPGDTLRAVSEERCSAVHGVPTIPFYVFYSIFGFQRVGDMIWSCGDMLARGFLLGGTSGRTTLNGEGLQHEDGHSHVVALSGNPWTQITSGRAASSIEAEVWQASSTSGSLRPANP